MAAIDKDTDCPPITQAGKEGSATAAARFSEEVGYFYIISEVANVNIKLPWGPL